MIRAFALSSLCLLLVGFQDVTYTLREVPVLGSESSFKVAMKMEAPSLNLSMAFDTTMKISKLEADGAFEIESTMTNTKTTINGEEITGEDQTLETTKYDKDGKKIKDESEEDEPDPFSDAIDAIMQYEPKTAVKSGDTWERESEFGTLTLKLTGTRKEDGVDVLVISTSGTLDKKDVSGEVKGIHLIRVKDFSVQKSEVTVTNAKFDPESEAGKLELLIERKG